MSTIAEKLAQVQAEIAAAAQRAGRDPEEITLVGVAKTRTVEEIKEAVAAGLQHVGENYAQELRDKQRAVGDGPTWHFVGHLQTNKAKYVVPTCVLIHSLDSVRVAEAIGKRAERIGKQQGVLVEVNASGEETKFGVQPDELESLLAQIAPLPGIEVQGLMTMPPWGTDPEEARPWFRTLRELRDDVQSRSGSELAHLSMGMTADFEVAVEEGATIVRIGTAIFGPRP